MSTIITMQNNGFQREYPLKEVKKHGHDYWPSPASKNFSQNHNYYFRREGISLKIGTWKQSIRDQPLGFALCASSR